MRGKCERCDKPATWHVTEIQGGKPVEYHYCEDCFKTCLEELTPRLKPINPGV